MLSTGHFRQYSLAFDNCVFLRNTAASGGAVAVLLPSSGDPHMSTISSGLAVLVSNCIFSGDSLGVRGESCV